MPDPNIVASTVDLAKVHTLLRETLKFSSPQIAEFQKRLESNHTVLRRALLEKLDALDVAHTVMPELAAQAAALTVYLYSLISDNAALAKVVNTTISVTAQALNGETPCTDLLS